jgi:chromosome segregation ATPase
MKKKIKLIEDEIRNVENEYSEKVKESLEIKKALASINKDLQKINNNNNIDWLSSDSTLIETILKKIDKQIKQIKVQSKNEERKMIYNKDKYIQSILETKKIEGESSGIVGVIAEIGYISDDKMDKVISTIFTNGMNIVVMKNKESTEVWKKKYENVVDAKISFLPLDSIYKPKKNENNGKIIFDDIDYEGFMGYAVNLIELKEEDEYLRSCFYAIIGDTIIFDNYDNGYEFRKQQIKNSKHCPRIYTLNCDKIEQSGIVYAGKPVDTKYR